MATVALGFNDIAGPIVRGEDRGADRPLQFSGEFDSNPSGWSIQFTIVPEIGDNLMVESPDITVAVTGTGPYSAVFSVPLFHAQTLTLPAGTADWQLERIDSGGYAMLGRGTIEILEPRFPLGP
jgi:hypothetical protein